MSIKTSLVKVVKKSGNKTVKAELSFLKRHALYKKVTKQVRTCMVHDENNVAKVGDTIMIEYSRPISKNKHWILSKVVS